MLKKLTTLIICLSLFHESVYAVSTGAESSIVICSDTNQILYAENHTKKLPMASTTKIMTAIIALENADPGDTVKVSANAARQEGSSMYLKAEEEVLLENLLYGLMLNSGNDAAMAIAEHISASTDDFALLMNEKANQIGCKNTNFKNPSGLPDPEHYSTAYDMALIMSYAMKNDTFANITAAKEHQVESSDGITYLRNHNRLLWQYPYTIGGKTGYTKSAGRCFVSAAKKDGVTLVAVTLNDRSDWLDHQNLLDYGFEKAKMTSVLSENDILCTRKIRGVRLNILSGNSLQLPLKDGRKKHIKCKIRLRENITEEITYGTNLGIGEIYVGDFFVGRIDLISGQSFDAAKNNALLNSFDSIFKNALLD